MLDTYEMKAVSNRMCDGILVSKKVILLVGERSCLPRNYKHKSPLLDLISGSLLRKSFYKI